MRWQDEGIVLCQTDVCEKNIRLTLFSFERGKQSGLIYRPSSTSRAGGKRRSSVLSTGDIVQANWNARLEQHLGRFAIESLHSPTAYLLDSALKLWSVQHVCELMTLLPQGHPYPQLYEHLKTLLENLAHIDPIHIVHQICLFELLTLSQLGFGLDLTQCCVTQQTHDLVFVSPKSGRAVSHVGAGEFTPYMLPLPTFWLTPQINTNWEDYQNSLKVTGYFFKKWVLTDYQHLPYARSHIEKYCANISQQTKLVS